MTTRFSSIPRVFIPASMRWTVFRRACVPLRVRARDARGNSSNELSHLVSIGRRRRGAIFATFRYRRAADNGGGYAIIRVTAADAEMTWSGRYSWSFPLRRCSLRADKRERARNAHLQTRERPGEEEVKRR